MSKPTMSTGMTLKEISLSDACTLAIAAGTASDYAGRSMDEHVIRALNKLSLRFAELAMQELGGDPAPVPGDEARDA